MTCGGVVEFECEEVGKSVCWGRSKFEQNWSSDAKDACEGQISEGTARISMAFYTHYLQHTRLSLPQVTLVFSLYHVGRETQSLKKVANCPTASNKKALEGSASTTTKGRSAIAPAEGRYVWSTGYRRARVYMHLPNTDESWTNHVKTLEQDAIRLGSIVRVLI